MSSRINKQTNKNKNITKRILRGYAATPEVALPENQKKLLIQKNQRKYLQCIIIMNKKKKNFFAIFILWNQEKTKQNQIDKKEKHKIRVFVSWKKEKNIEKLSSKN